MSQLRKPLTAGAADEYINFVITRLEAGDDATALEAALRAFDSAAAGEVVKQRLNQVLNTLSTTRIISNGQVTATMTLAGTGYSVGDIIPVVGDGEGAAIEVLTVDEGTGAILTYRSVAGQGYVATAAADSTDVGGGDATFTVAISNEQDIVANVSAAVAAAV